MTDDTYLSFTALRLDFADGSPGYSQHYAMCIAKTRTRPPIARDALKLARQRFSGRDAEIMACDLLAVDIDEEKEHKQLEARVSA